MVQQSVVMRSRRCLVVLPYCTMATVESESTGVISVLTYTCCVFLVSCFLFCLVACVDCGIFRGKCVHMCIEAISLRWALRKS